MDANITASTIRLTIDSGLGRMVMKQTGDGPVLRLVGANPRGLGGRYVAALPYEVAAFERAVAQRAQA